LCVLCNVGDVLATAAAAERGMRDSNPVKNSSVVRDL
jgi:hypothetical protein